MGEVTELVENAIRALIEDGKYPPGSKLPSERNLVKELGAGRTTVRSVLSKLAARGLIRSQHGSGYFVMPVEGSAGPSVTDVHADDSLRWQTFGERTIYNNPWVRLNLVEVQPPGGGERFEHHVVRLYRVAVTLVVDDADRVLMLWRHRFVSDSWGWELPNGIVDQGEEPAVTAVRAVEEETGWRPGPVKHLITYQPMIGMVDSPHELYMAHGATRIGEPGDSDEARIVRWIPIAEIPGLMKRNKLLGSGTLLAVLHLLAFRNLSH
jgi:8-oxo-dGTP pyrophosphatase MutT (NUDIX family)